MTLRLRLPALALSAGLAAAYAGASDPGGGTWQPLYFASDGASGNLPAGEWTVEIVFPDGRTEPARSRPHLGPDRRAGAGAAVRFETGLHEVFVPDAASEGRLRLTPRGAAEGSALDPWMWRPAEDDRGTVWFELPRRVVHGTISDRDRPLPAREIRLRFSDTGEPLGRLRSDSAGGYGINLPAGEGAARFARREVAGEFFGPDIPPQWSGGGIHMRIVSEPGEPSGQNITLDHNPGPLAVPTSKDRPWCAGVYPNPWRTKESATDHVTFYGLKVNDGVDIYTLTGEKVRTLGGPHERLVCVRYAPDPRYPVSQPDKRFWCYIQWDGRNTRGREVADGVYIFVINIDDLSLHHCNDRTLIGRLTILR